MTTTKTQLGTCHKHGVQPIGIVCVHVRDRTATRVFYGSQPGEESTDCMCTDCWDKSVADELPIDSMLASCVSCANEAIDELRANGCEFIEGCDDHRK